jgi:hypothetical protein
MASDELRTVLSPLLSCEEPLIWIARNSNVRLDDAKYGDRTVEDHKHEKQFTLSLRDTRAHWFSIHASTLEEAIICLDYLVGLKDTHFQDMSLYYNGHEEDRLCPFGAICLEKILQNSGRRIRFVYMISTPNHCRTLASSGTKKDIEFYLSDFQDEGAAFVEASIARQDETSGPAKLRLDGGNPFNDRNWALFLKQHKLELLHLISVYLNSEVSYRAVATAEVRCLTFGDEECELEDGGAALVESVREGRGPKELSFLVGHPFNSSERLVAFMNVLRGNTNLEQLDMFYLNDRQGSQALSAALRVNKGLVHLGLLDFEMNEWDGLLESISIHPSLRSLNLKVWGGWNNDSKKRREVTKTVADMLSVNKRVVEMSFDHKTFIEDDWDTFVVPRLECNRYRERFPSIHKIGEASTRAAVLARALAKFASKPHLVWMLLNQNHDIISTFLDSALTHDDRVSTPSRSAIGHLPQIQ